MLYLFTLQADNSSSSCTRLNADTCGAQERKKKTHVCALRACKCLLRMWRLWDSKEWTQICNSSFFWSKGFSVNVVEKCKKKPKILPSDWGELQESNFDSASDHRGYGWGRSGQVWRGAVVCMYRAQLWAGCAQSDKETRDSIECSTFSLEHQRLRYSLDIAAQLVCMAGEQWVMDTLGRACTESVWRCWIDVVWVLETLSKFTSSFWLVWYSKCWSELLRCVPSPWRWRQNFET